jgi:vancomycin permeability regulator SanA
MANSHGRTFNDVVDVPHCEYGLLLATSPITRFGTHNFYFDNRIKATDELYKAGKIDYIIASGGNYVGSEQYGCDEPAAIRDSLVARGVPKDRIILDYEGTQTVNSIVKAKDCYGIDSVILISQKDHNQRALYMARHYGLNAICYNAEEPMFISSKVRNRTREYFARVKMFFDLWFGSKPSFEVENLNIEQYTEQAPVTVIDSCGLRIYYPHYSKIDLVCGSMPSKSDSTIIMFAEAAFTGELLDEFKHSNIAGDHVTGGKRERGYKCKRNTGAFVYYNGAEKFCYPYQSANLDFAAEHGGCGFTQEMMIHEAKIVPHTRKDSNSNEFRALCLIGYKIAIVDSQEEMSFGNFISNLLSIGVTEALYLDMGVGWNYSWYRDANGTTIPIHSAKTKYATNWIVFYK